jgi:hypothetical protein
MHLAAILFAPLSTHTPRGIIATASEKQLNFFRVMQPAAARCRDGKVMHALAGRRACFVVREVGQRSEIALAAHLCLVLRGASIHSARPQNVSTLLCKPYKKYINVCPRPFYEHYLQFFCLSSCTHTHTSPMVYIPQQRDLIAHQLYAICSLKHLIAFILNTKIMKIVNFLIFSGYMCLV